MNNHELEIQIELYNRLKATVDELSSSYGSKRALEAMRTLIEELAMQGHGVVYMDENQNLDYINGDNNPDDAA